MTLWKRYRVRFDVRHHYTMETSATSADEAIRKVQASHDRQGGQNFVFTLIDSSASDWAAEEIDE